MPNLKILPANLCTDIFSHSLLLTNQVGPLSQALNDQFVAFRSAVDIPDIVGRGLEVAGCVVTLGDEDVVVYAAFQWLVEWDWGALGFLGLLKE